LTGEKPGLSLDLELFVVIGPALGLGSRLSGAFFLRQCVA